MLVKKTAAIIVCLLTIVSYLFCNTLPRSPRTYFFTKAATTVASTPADHFNLSGTPLDIPVGYLGIPTPAGDVTSLLLSAIWPQMTPSRLPSGNFARMTTGESQIEIVLQDASGTTSIDFRTNVALQRIVSTVPEAPRFGLNHARVPEGQDNTMLQSQFGDVYYISSVDQGHATLIVCELQTDFFAHPQCQQDILLGTLLFQIYFNKTLLPVWQDVDQRVFNLYRRFVTKS
jgi:hypothetical protein